MLIIYLSKIGKIGAHMGSGLSLTLWQNVHVSLSIIVRKENENGA
jgi:hypothetical protein